MQVNRNRVLLGVAGFLAIASGVARGEDLYVSQSQTGAANGSSCASAFAAGYFNTSSNWVSGTGRISPGDTVHLCGNITTPLTFQGSGTAGNVITLLFETGASMTTSVWATAITMNNRSYVAVDGGVPCGKSGTCNGVISNTGNSTGGSHSTSNAISAQSCSNCDIRNLGISNIYVHSGSGSEVDQTRVNCINFSGSNISIHDNTMHDAGWCLINWTKPGDSNVAIYNNNIYNIDHGLVWGGTGSTSTTGSTVGPVSFHDNHIHDYAAWGTSNNAYHHDGIHCYSTGSGSLQAGVHWSDMWIYNNLFDGNTGGNLTSHIFLEAGVQTDGSQTPCMDATSKIHIFGNVLTITRPNADPNGVVDLGVHSASSPLQSLDYFNNTLLADDTTTATGTVALRIENGAASSSANIKNNIFGGANFLLMLASGPGIDYNGYVNCISGNCWGGTSNFSRWQTSCGCDSHSMNSVGSMGGVTQASGALQTGSAMTGKGAALNGAISSWPAAQQAALTTDRNGNPRGSVWDIGALATGTPTNGPAAPGALTVTVR